jgi:hypothetical protein
MRSEVEEKENMPRASGEVIIGRPLGDVFAFIANGENNSKWRSAVTDIALASGTAGSVGALYRQGMRGPGGRVPADYKITRCEPGKTLAFCVTTGPARPEGQYDFESVSSGTRVRFSLWWEPKGLARLLAPMVARQMPKEIGSLSTLKQVLEAGGG